MSPALSNEGATGASRATEDGCGEAAGTASKGAGGSGRRASAVGAIASGEACARRGSGVLESASRPTTGLPSGPLRRGSSIPNQITIAATACKPDAATAVGASREMAILIHTLNVALFGRLYLGRLKLLRNPESTGYGSLT